MLLSVLYIRIYLFEEKRINWTSAVLDYPTFKKFYLATINFSRLSHNIIILQPLSRILQPIPWYYYAPQSHIPVTPTPPTSTPVSWPVSINSGSAHAILKHQFVCAPGASWMKCNEFLNMRSHDGIQFAYVARVIPDPIDAAKLRKTLKHMFWSNE